MTWRFSKHVDLEEDTYHPGVFVNENTTQDTSSQHRGDHKGRIKRDSLANKLGLIAIVAHHQYIFMCHRTTQ